MALPEHRRWILTRSAPGRPYLATEITPKRRAAAIGDRIAGGGDRTCSEVAAHVASRAAIAPASPRRLPSTRHADPERPYRTETRRGEPTMPDNGGGITCRACSSPGSARGAPPGGPAEARGAWL